MIYISTGGFSRLTLWNAVKNLMDHGIRDIEISGCLWSDGDLEKIVQCAEQGIQIQPHNYFPSKKEPFVLNLASANADVIKTSMEHCRLAIDLARKLGRKYYSLHAGFLIELKVGELGKTISKQVLLERDSAKQRFIANIETLAEYAAINGVKLLIENNVLGEQNFKQFGENPLLMVEPMESYQILSALGGKVGMLLDVAHLKVSGKTLSFSAEQMFEKCEKYIEAYHLSDNSGFADENRPFDEDCWFWKYLKPNIDYISIEVYSSDIKILTSALKVVATKYGKN